MTAVSTDAIEWSRDDASTLAVEASASRVRAEHSLRWRRTLTLLLLAGDVSAAGIASVGASCVAFDLHPSPLRVASFHVAWPVVDAAMVLSWIIALNFRGGYHRSLLGTGNDAYRLVISSGALLLGIVATLLFVFGVDVQRSFVAVMLPSVVALTLLFRYLIRKGLHHGRRSGRWMRRVALYGTANSAAALARHIEQNPWSGLDVVGGCVWGGSESFRLPILGSADPDELLAAIRKHRIDTLAVTSEIEPGRLRSLAWSLRGSGVDLLVAPSITDIAGPRIAIRPLGGLPLLHVEEPELDWVSRVSKGVFDKVGSALVLIVTAPLLAAIALAIKLTSSGPVFYRHERTGRDGNSFMMVKFRTMVDGADRQVEELRDRNEAEGPLFKVRNDPRVTPVGRFLRRLSLDELPQLAQVFSGKMSLVGPRPPLPSEVEQYDNTTRRRLLVKPGLTGLWQVSGRSDLSWEESVRLDLFYIDHWSIAMDVTILLKTIAAVVRARGAY